MAGIGDFLNSIKNSIGQDFNPNNPNSDVAQVKALADPYVQAAGVIPQGLHDWGSIVSNMAHSMTGGKIGTAITGQEQPTFTTQQNIDNITQHPVKGALNTAMMAPMALTSFAGGKEGNPDEQVAGDEEAAGLAKNVGNARVKTPPTPEETTANTNRQIPLNGRDIKTSDDIATVNAAYNKYGGTGTAHSQVTNVFGQNGAMGKLSQQAHAQINAEGGTTASSDIDNSVLQNLQSKTNASEIGAKDMQTGAQKYIDDVYSRSMGGNVTPNTTAVAGSNIFTPTTGWQELPKGISELPSEGGFERWEDPNSGKTYVRWDAPPKQPIPVQTETVTRLMPPQVPDSTLLKMKSIINQDAAKTYSKDPAAWTTNEKIARYSRDSLDQIIDTKHPGVASINDEMSALYKGYDPMMDNANTETKAAAKAANTPPPPKEPGFLSNVWTEAKKDPLKAGAEGLGGLAAASYAVSKLAGPVGGFISSELSKANQPPATTAPTPTSNMPPAYAPVTPQDAGVMDDNSYGQQSGQLQSQVDSNKLNNPNAANDAQAKLDQLTATYNSQKPVRDELGTYNNVANLASDATSTLATTPASILNSNAGFESMMKANSGPYAGFATQLAKLSQAVGVDLTTAKSPQALKSAIDKAVTTEKAKLKAVQTTFTGSSNPTTDSSGFGATQSNPQGLPAPTNQPPMNWQQNDPQVQAILNTGHQ